MQYEEHLDYHTTILLVLKPWGLLQLRVGKSTLFHTQTMPWLYILILHSIVTQHFASYFSMKPNCLQQRHNNMMWIFYLPWNLSNIVTNTVVLFMVARSPFNVIAYTVRARLRSTCIIFVHLFEESFTPWYGPARSHHLFSFSSMYVL